MLPRRAARPRAGGRSRLIRPALIGAAFLGLVLVVWLIVRSGAEEVARAMLLVGWGLAAITAFHLLPMFLSALSWRELLPRASRLDIASVTWVRWIRESINSLLPVAGVGGDVACARLAHLLGVPGKEATASMMVDVTVGAATQLLYVAIGVALLLLRSTAPAVLAVASATLVGIAIFIAVIAAFVLLQHRGMLALSARLAGGLLRSERVGAAAGGAAAVDGAITALYRDRGALWRASLIRLLGWAAGTGETWLVTLFLGQPLGLTDAFILESLGAGVRGAAFMVPGQLGVLEGSFVVFGALFGLPPDAALVISLARRVRELALGLPGLIVWHWLETRRLLRRAPDESRP